MVTHRMFLAALLFLGISPLSLQAESRMVFPRIVFQQGRFSGVAIANPTSSSAAITLTAYNPDGTLFKDDGVTNPRTETIEAGSQYVRLGWQIFTPPASVTGSPAAKLLWMEVVSGTDGLTGFFLEGDDASQFLDGSDLSGTGADLIIPYIQHNSDLSTEISIVNPDASGSADVLVEMLNSSGSAVRSHTLVLPAHAALQGVISDLFSGSYDSITSVRVRSSRPLAIIALLSRKSENSLVAVISRKGNAPLRTLYFPQLAQGGDWSTYLGLSNLTSANILVTITAYKKDGTLFSAPTVQNNPVTQALPGGGSLRTDVKSLFGFASTDLQEGWIKAEAGGPALTGYVEYGAGTNRALVSAQSEAVTQAIFSYQVNGGGYYTGIAVLNPSTIAANVDLVSMEASGTVLGKTRRALRPGQREAVLIEQWIPGAAGATNGSVYLKSDIPIVATQLFGTSTFTALSNVPPQAVPATFDPGSSIPTLKVSPPLAVVETGKTLNFHNTGPAVGAWKVNDVAGGHSSTGTVSAAGLFTAPSLVPTQHTQTVTAVTSGGDQTSAASVDIVQRETLISGLTLLTAVAYFDNLQRFFIAEQQLASSAPEGRTLNAGAASTRISEVSTAGTATSFVQVSNDTVVKMVPFTDGGGASHLLLAGYDTGSIYRLTLSTKQISTVATGLSQPNSLALDPATGDLLVSEGGANRVTVIAKSAFDPSPAAPSASQSWGPEPRLIPIAASPRGVAFDPCTGALYVSTADGVVREFLDNRERQVAAGLNNPGQLLVLMRQGYPSCFEAVTLFVAEPNRVVQMDPRTGEIISFLDGVQEVRDLGFFPGGSPFAQNGEDSIIVGDGPAGINLSRILIVRVGRLYQRVPLDAGLLDGLVFPPAGDAIAYRDRRGDTFATIKSRQMGLAIPDIIGISIYRIAGNCTVTVEFANPVSAWSRGLPNSVMGWIDFDTQSGGGLPSHADPYRPIRPELADTDAYVDLTTGQLYMAAAEPSIRSEAGGMVGQVAMSFFGNTLSVVIPTTFFDAFKSKVNVTVGNAAEVTDIAPEARYAFLNLGTGSVPVVQFEAMASRAVESAGTVNLNVTLSAASTKTVTVQYAVTGGTATGGGVDYTLASGTLSFAPGETAKGIPLAIVNDTIDEPDETVIVTLSNPSNATLGNFGTHTFTIIDDDNPTPSVQFALSTSSAPESTASPNLSVILSNVATQVVSVQYAVTGGTATGGGVDYTLASGTLTFALGQTSLNIPLTVINDTIDEPNETIIVTLSNPINATLGAGSTHTFTIIDDDPTPSVQFAASASSGSESVGAVNVNVSLSNPSTQTITVQYAVTGGTATPFSPTNGVGDFTLAPGTLTFAPGQTLLPIPMTVVSDSIYEPDETVIVTLSNPVNSVLGAIQSHTYTILNDDPIPTVQFVGSASSDPEGVRTVNLSVTLSNPASTAITVNYTYGGTAIQKIDFDPISYSPLTFSPGQTQQYVTFNEYDDARTEDPYETIVVTLTSTSTNARLGANVIYTCTIIDNDRADLVFLSTPPLDVRSNIISWPSGSITFTSVTIQNSGNVAAGPFSVSYYLSTDQTITSSDTLLGSLAVSQGLLVGQPFYTPVPTWPLPAGVSPGIYYVGVLADSDSVVPELNENNNVSNVVRIEVVAPDLAVSALSATPGLLRLQINIASTIVNQGTANAGTFTVGCYLQATQIFDPRDKPVFTIDVPGLIPKATYNFSRSISALAAGTWYVHIRVDDFNVITESNESNNISTVRVIL